jgi:integrase
LAERVEGSVARIGFDIDLDEGLLSVTGTLKRMPAGLVVETPKTPRSAATIPLPRSCMAALVKQRELQEAERQVAGSRWHETGFVFTTPIGTPVDPDNLTKFHYWVCEQAGIGRRRFHALRHTTATLLHQQGVPLEVISATLRHASLAITQDIYVSFRPRVERRGADAMDRLLGGASANEDDPSPSD